ncbi:MULTISPECIES: hypothetical protein [Nocardiaceae]|jgi:hypothetical protein|uniref:hypothetical protein n=1 Tax=Nocardiaceae TaxID=85025 RepID=UPI0005636093|nr:MULTISPECIES: hypothetical protein [Rhodococcus]OZF04751.1 hypothetical protein CH301_04815 [Rhodococcus sp. 15-1189-1-1a]OZF19016.1 hypothetical protein CH299_05360 [Rhodococcus sp. 14-2686-1-2]
MTDNADHSKTDDSKTDDSNTDDSSIRARPEDSPKGGHPGPVDEGKNGGMATRELAPDLADGDAAEGKSSD